MLSMEVAAHAPVSLSRTHTAPPSSFHSRLHSSGGQLHSPMDTQSHQSFTSSHYSTYSHPSSHRSSDSTQTTSHSSTPAPPLPTSTPINGGPVEAANNVLNRRGDKETSLFQICLNLKQRLRNVPGFAPWLVEVEKQAVDEDTDPVTQLWRTFRKGYPLMAIYNALDPAARLSVDDSKISERKRDRTATYKFLQACVSELKFPSSECFILSDLYGDDTTGFVKVTKVVNRVLDILVQQGIINSAVESPDAGPDHPTNGKKSQREHIIDELVRTERTYVQHLELLLDFKKLVEEKGITTGDAIYDIFLNLNALLDFQRRFLIRVEQTNAQPDAEQNWGKLFILFKDSFKVYEPYIANQKKCEEVAMREFDKLRETGGPPELCQMVESPTHFTSFLLKPFQRLAKYPLLLRELRDKGDLDEERCNDITAGIAAATSVLQASNAAVDEEERKEAVRELVQRVEDWKGHHVEGFGDLLLHGTFTVVKGDVTNSNKDQEREYKIFLFEKILLCCKEMNPNKQKNKVMGRSAVDRTGKPKLQLKGRIFMQNVTECISLSKPGSYTCQIFWKGDPGIENFVIRFATEEVMRKWADQVNAKRKLYTDYPRASSQPQTSHGTQNSQFIYMQSQTQLENPYLEEYQDDDDDDVDTVVPGGHPTTQLGWSVDRNASSASLRSRSTTGDSGPLAVGSENRQPPPRFPMGFTSQPALTLRTQQLQMEGAKSPNGGPMDSYFSPGVESPISSRTSSSSAGTFPFPRQPVPPQHGWHGDEPNRFTAPAMARNASRDGSGTAGTYPSHGRSQMQRPSLPPSAGSQQSISQNRLRSASSPNIQTTMEPGRRMPNGAHHPPPVPDLPPFPTHYAYTPGINRSQSSSPNNPVNVPARAATQSPNVQRERLLHSRGSDQNDYHYSGPTRHEPRHGPTSGALPRAITPGNPDHHSRAMTPASLDHRTMSPPLPSHTPLPAAADIPIPSQLKVKVHCPSAGSTMTLVVGTNISYQSLKDRIDAKLQRSTNVSLSSGQVKLKYLDDDDYVNIQSDEDVQTAFESWKEQQRDQILAGQMGEIVLYCQR